MKIVITGSSSGMGAECAKKFLALGHEVHGIDILPSSIVSDGYIHHIADVAILESLPEIEHVNILINNAGVQNSSRDIEVNLVGTINCTEKYAFQPSIVSVLNQASCSAHTGDEFPRYAASKGGVISYTKHVASKLAKYGATCNSLSFGGVTTNLNDCVMNDANLWNQIMELTPLKKWATEKEAAEWIYFFTVVNKSCTGQDLLIDNGETLINNFVWANN